jgi:hypothetical protein
VEAAIFPCRKARFADRPLYLSPTGPVDPGLGLLDSATVTICQ